MSEVTNSNIAKWLATASAARLISQLVSWGCTILVMRTLRPEDYGAVALAEAVFTFALIFMDYPFQVYLTRAKTAVFNRRREVMSVAFGLAILLSALMLMFAIPLANFYATPELKLAFALKAIHLLAMPLRLVPEAELLRSLKFSRHAASLFAEVLVSAIVSLILALNGAGFLALLVGPLAGTVARVIFMSFAARSYLLPSFTRIRYKKHLRCVRRLISNDLILRVDTPITLIAAGLILTPKDLGLFSAAQYWAAIPVGKALAVLNQVTLPVFSKLRDSATDTAQVIHSFLLAFAIIATPVFWGLAAVAPEFVSAILGDSWNQAAILLAVMSLGMPLRLIRDFSIAPLTARHMDKEVNFLHFIHTSTQISFAVIGAFAWGPLGAAIGMMIASLVDGVVAHTRTSRILNVDPWPIRQRLLICSTFALVMLLVVRVSSMPLKTLILELIPKTLGPVFLLTTLVLIGALTYSLCIGIFMRKDLLPILKNLLKR